MLNPFWENIEQSNSQSIDGMEQPEHQQNELKEQVAKHCPGKIDSQQRQNVKSEE
jgi:hypothetical protein